MSKKPSKVEDWSLPWRDYHGSAIPPATSEPLPLPTPTLPPEIPTDSIDPNLLSLAMAFVPRQIWETPYQYDVSLKRGTIFPSLDKPFLGEEASKNE